MKSFNVVRQEALESWKTALTEGSQVPVIYLGTASCGRAAGAMDVLDTIRETLAELNLPARIVQVGRFLTCPC
jgi:NADH-quinone oxidoreductase subunit F